MNAVGKTLVVFNLLFALAVAGFIAITYSTGQNWAKAYRALEDEMKVAALNYKVGNETMAKLNKLYKQAQEDLVAERVKVTENDAKAKADQTTLQLQLDNEKQKVQDALLNSTRATEERGRLQEEVKGLLATLKKREQNIVTLEDALKEARTQAVASEGRFRITQERNEELLKRIAQLELALARQVAGGSETSKDPNAPNPPATYIKGVIEKIDARDAGLVQLSIGSDHGINKNHTLEVYRLTPRPEYLGMVRVVEIDHHRSVARLIRSGSGSRSPLREGDTVASTIGR